MKQPLRGAILAVLFAAAAGSAAGREAEPLVYVIPIKGMIERGLLYVVRRGVAEAADRGASAIVIDMDTPGGRVDAAEELVGILAGSAVPTYTYVNPNAISAGAILAMATDHIYMAPSSRIGDAMPIQMSMFGSAEPMSEAHEEKAVSYVASLIRSAAQRKGHDERLAEAMVRRELEYEIGDLVVCAEGQLLTLTNVEAERQVTRDGRQQPLLSMGTVDSLPDLLEQIGLGGAQRQSIEISPAEKIARYIELFSVLFLVGGLLGLYVEFKTPGFGVPGIVGILLLAVWFWGHHVAGLAGMGEAVLFLLGVCLLAIEIFVIPGFGFVGVTGIVLMLTALAMAMVQHYPGGPVFRLPQWHLMTAARDLSLAMIITAVAGTILGRYLPHTPGLKRLILESSQTHGDGFDAAAQAPDLVGLEGTAETPLHPGGIGVFGDRRLSVVSRGTFIEAGTPIVIAAARGNHIVVESCSGRAQA